MLAEDSNGPTDFKNGNKNGWPARRRKEPSKTTKRTRKDIPQKKKKPYHAMGKVINNDINWIKLKPIDFAPSDSSK